MAIDIRPGQLPHIFWIDLEQDGTLTECAVMKQDGMGNIYYFPINSLDSIDKRRILRIIQNRNAPSFELWDLMSNITLNNGINALDYFHQLVQVLTPSGVKMSPRSGVVGAERSGTYKTTPKQEAATQQSAPAPTAPQSTPVEQSAEPTNPFGEQSQQVSESQQDNSQKASTTRRSQKKTAPKKDTDSE